MVDQAIKTIPDKGKIDNTTYDISKIDFDRLRKEFEKSSIKRTTVQSLKMVIEDKLQRLIEQNPLRTDFQRHYEEIIAEYNREKDRATIEKTFEDLLRFFEDDDLYYLFKGSEEIARSGGFDIIQFKINELLDEKGISSAQSEALD